MIPRLQELDGEEFVSRAQPTTAQEMQTGQVSQYQCPPKKKINNKLTANMMTAPNAVL